MKKRKSRGPLKLARKPMMIVGFILGTVVLLAVAVVWDQLRKSQNKADLSGLELASKVLEIEDQTNLESLRQLYAKLEDEMAAANIAGKLELTQERLRVSRRVRQIAATDGDKSWGQAKELTDLSLLYSIYIDNRLDSQAIEKQLIASMELAAGSMDKDIVALGRVARVIYEMNRVVQLSKSNRDTSRFQSSLKALAQFHLEDPTVISAINSGLTVFLPRLSTTSIPATEQNRLFQQVIQNTADAFSTAQSPDMVAWVKSLRDNVTFLKFNFSSLRRGCQLGEQNARAQFLECYAELISRLQTADGLGELVPVAQHFERFGWYQSGREIYDALLQALEKMPDQGSTPTVAQSCRQGVQRLALLWQPLNLQATDIQGQPIDFTVWRQKVVLVLFLANAEDLSVYSIIQQDLRLRTDKDLRILLVFRSETALKDFERNIAADWAIATTTVEPNFSGPMSQQCPVNSSPYSVLLDRAGTVASLDSDIGILLIEIDRLMKLSLSGDK